MVSKGEINIATALKKRKDSGISRGTHYRILEQGKKNIVESLFTVAVGVQIGLLKWEDVEKLISMVSTIPPDVDEARLSEVTALAKVLADRIVML